MYANDQNIYMQTPKNTLCGDAERMRLVSVSPADSGGGLFWPTASEYPPESMIFYTTQL